MKMIGRYAELLATKGVSLEGLGIAERALRRDDALEAVHALEGSLVSILGGDVYVQRQGAVQPAYANWYADRRDGEPQKEFAVRSWLKAEGYISDYPRKENEQPLFVLVLSTTDP